MVFQVMGNEKISRNEKDNNIAVIPEPEIKPTLTRLNIDTIENVEFDFPRRSCRTLSYPGALKLHKIGKTVRFADVLGLDLCDYRAHILSPETNIGPEPFQTRSQNNTNKPNKFTVLSPMFNQPSQSLGYVDLLRKQKVCLEKAGLDKNCDISGMVGVMNIIYAKVVVVHWTTDQWMSSKEELAKFSSSSHDGATDTFHFRLSPGKLPVGGKLEFCIRFVSGSQVFWDNNGGVNYSFYVVPRGSGMGTISL